MVRPRSVLLRLAALSLAIPILGACGDSAPGTAADPTQQPSAGEQLVTCGGPGFPPSVMETGVAGVLTQDEAVAIFTEMIERPESGEELAYWFPDGPGDTEWKVLRDDGDVLTFALGPWTATGPAGEGALVMGAERRADGWHWTGGNDCSMLAPVLEGPHSWVVLTAPPGGLDRSATRLTVLVNELQCTSGRDPSEFLEEPRVEETADSVTVFWTSEPVSGGADCQGNPSVERTIELDDPLGERELLDGSTYPPAPVSPSLPE